MLTPPTDLAVSPTPPSADAPTPSNPLSLPRLILILIAIFALMLAYFAAHRPFRIEPGNIPPIVFLLGGAVLDIVTAALVFLVAGAVGGAFFRLTEARFGTGWHLERLSRLERLPLQTGIGLGALALVAVCLGLIGLFHGAILWGLAALAVIVLRRSLIDTLRAWAALIGAVRPSTVWEGMTFIYVGFALLLALAMALTPPTHWDSMTYHLLAPTRYLEAGRISAQPDNFYLGFSQNIEMLYSYAIGLFGRDTAAAPIHFGIGLLALLGTVGVVRRFAGRWTGWMALLLLMSAQNLWGLFGWAYVDLGTLLYGALALIAVTAWENGRAPAWIILMGVIAGLAAGIKYNAGALGIAMGVYVLLHTPRRAVIGYGLLMIGAAVVVFLPWALKGALLYGNPIYPFAFGGISWDAGRMEAFSFPEQNFIGREWLLHLPFLPIAATIFGRDLEGGYGFEAGAWLLTSFALLPIVWRVLTDGERHLARAAAVFIGTLWVFWAGVGLTSGIGVQTRLMIMVFPAFAGAGALVFAVIRRLPKKPIMVDFILRSFFVISLALTSIYMMQTVLRDRVVSMLFGETSYDEYMYVNLEAYYNAMKYLPEGTQVRQMFEPRGYYCPSTVTCVADMAFDHWLRPLLAGATPTEVLASYRAAGDDSLLVSHAIYEEYLKVSRDPALDGQLMAAIDTAMTPIWTDGFRYTLYAWK